MFPSASLSPTSTASTTSLFFISAYPTTSPVNQSGILGVASGGGTNQESRTATILGGVAVGIAGIGAVVFAIQYLRKGGSISGLVNAEKDTLTSLSKMIPITDAQRTKITSMVHNTKKLIPTTIQKAIEQKFNPEETVPTEQVPEETVPVETVPVETVPVETTPSEQVIVETTPSEQVIVETTPSEQVPVDDLQILAPVTSTPAVLTAKPTTTSTILNPTTTVKSVSKPTLSIPSTLSKPTITATQKPVQRPGQKPIQRPGQTPKKPASVPTVVASLVGKNPEPTTLDTTPPLIHELNLPTVSEPEDSKIPILVRPEDRAHVEAFLKSRQKM